MPLELGVILHIDFMQTPDLPSVTDIHLTFTTLGAHSADGKLMMFFLFFPENRL